MLVYVLNSIAAAAAACSIGVNFHQGAGQSRLSPPCMHTMFVTFVTRTALLLRYSFTL
jgi:hypothetical protein